MHHLTFVVVGANLCGGAAVQTLRTEGFDGRLILVGEEPRLPYERPSLSKRYLQDCRVQPDDLLLLPPDWYAEHAVETRLGQRATRIDPTARTVELETGERLVCDRILLATGGRPRHLSGLEAERVGYLRTVADADRIRSWIAPGRHLVVIGAGFIGAEVAASARRRGAAVTMLEMLPVPMARVLGEEIGRVYAAIHRDEGVDVRTGEAVDRVEPAPDGVVVHTTTGAALRCDAVVVGVGMEPNVELARVAGAKVDNGILVDPYCQTTVEGIYAAGDVANHDHPLVGRRLRVEHFDHAIKQGAAAARNMLGQRRPYDEPHWFWSDQYDHTLQVAGVIDLAADRVVRGSLAGRSFVAFWLRGAILVAALGLNRAQEVRAALRLIRQRMPVDPTVLQNEDVPLARLARR